MKERSERSLVLFSVLIVFACLLVSGLPRLIGHEACDVPKGPASYRVPALICSISDSFVQSGSMHKSAEDESNPAGKGGCLLSGPPVILCSDANGNVLAAGTYLHAVYWAFALGDGFV